MKHWMVASILIAWFATAQVASCQTKQDSRLENAALALDAIMKAPDNSIPADLLNRAVCVGVIPSEKKIAFFIGGNYGYGALVCRRNGNGPWGAPSMIKLKGGSYGLQLGGEATDIVFIVISHDTAEKIMRQTL